MRRASLAGLVGAAVSVALALVVPSGTASAHAGLENSIPAASSVLEESPTAITLDFDEPIEAGLTSIQLFDDQATLVETGDPTAAGDDVVTASVPTLDDGLYAVVWRITSIDGHVIDGAFSFQVGSVAAGDGSSLLDEVSGDATVAPAVSRLADVARFAGFVGVVLLLGAGLVALMGPQSLTTSPATRVIVVGGWVMLVLASLASFGLLGATAVAGTLGDAFSPDVWGKVVHSRTGRMLLVRAALALVGGGLLLTIGSRATAWWRSVAMAVAVGLVFTFPASGHPASRSPQALWVLLDAVHLGSVVVWVGGLALFTLGGRAWLRDDEGAPVVRRFSAAAVWLVPIIVITGSLQTIELAGGLDGVRALTDTGWGRTLLVKLSVVSVLVALGAVSRWVLQTSGHTSLRRTVAAEAFIGVVVLGLTASLVSLSPEPAVASKVFTTTITEAGNLADITITPGRVGANEVHIVVTPAGNSLTPAAGATARMTLPSRDIPDTPVTLVADGPNHFTGNVTLAFSGDWTFELVLEPTPGSTVLLSTTVPIP
ncbi:MAG: copper resistance protein CopC [Ilumatobacteraceae bacterium]